MDGIEIGIERKRKTKTKQNRTEQNKIKEEKRKPSYANECTKNIFPCSMIDVI